MRNSTNRRNLGLDWYHATLEMTAVPPGRSRKESEENSMSNRNIANLNNLFVWCFIWYFLWGKA
jgi:hypothetical protein